MLMAAGGSAVTTNGADGLTLLRAMLRVRGPAWVQAARLKRRASAPRLRAELVPVSPAWPR